MADFLMGSPLLPVPTAHDRSGSAEHTLNPTASVTPTARALMARIAAEPAPPAKGVWYYVKRGAYYAFGVGIEKGGLFKFNPVAFLFNAAPQPVGWVPPTLYGLPNNWLFQLLFATNAPPGFSAVADYGGYSQAEYEFRGGETPDGAPPYEVTEISTAGVVMSTRKMWLVDP